MPLDPGSILLSDRVALVTGAGAGIGRATAVGLARLGAHLALCDRDATGLAETAGAVEAEGRRVASAVLDVRESQAVADFVAGAAERLGALEVLVNNAGGSFRADFLGLSAGGQAALVEENFGQVCHLIRCGVSRMSERGGSVVNVTSVEAFRAAPGYAVYAAMKAAQESLTRSLALELAGRRIRVNAVAPDLIPTPGTGPIGVRAPLGIEGHVDHVAGAVAFLASDLAAFVTGTTLHVDGGSLAAGAWRRTPGGDFAL